MKIFTANQIKEIDRLTIDREPISSLDLMDRAASKLYEWLQENIPLHEHSFIIFCGNGNNGGDGLSLAAKLKKNGIDVQIVLVKGSTKRSPENQTNLNEIKSSAIRGIEDLSHLSKAPIIVDALFGTGLSREITGEAAHLVGWINKAHFPTISIDIPSGLFADTLSDSQTIVRADLVLTLQMPKVIFFMPEAHPYVPDFRIIDIGLDATAIEQTESLWHLITPELIGDWIRPRAKFSHKGDFGHALLLAGSSGKVGAALLAARACLRIGAGLLSVDIPADFSNSLHDHVPEAMIRDQDNVDDTFYTAIGIGCGLSTSNDARQSLERTLGHLRSSIVLDADALNLISENPHLWDRVPNDSIITPHPGEFRRLVGPVKSHFEAWDRQVALAKERQIVVVLKGAHTKIALPDGRTYFNPSGNPGMATAGSGDVLTGIILGLLAQHYPPTQAAILGVYLHGAAGDCAVQTVGEMSLVASDIIQYLPQVIRALTSEKTWPWNG